MHKYIFSTIIIFILAGCNQPPTDKKSVEDTVNENASRINVADKKVTAFIIDFGRQKEGLVYFNSTLRSSYHTKKDATEIESYFNKIEHPEYIKEFAIEHDIEKTIDTSITHQNIIWVNDADIYTCRTVLRDLWPCFKNKYGGQSFYYFSIPMFSRDGEYALMNINFLSSNKSESRGGTSVFKRINNLWEEVAVLTNWGAMPQD